MESRKGKGPGRDPLGHSPFSKVKLEGPKKHHDDHGKDASYPGVAGEKAVPGGAWEVQYNPRVEKNTSKTLGAEFNPKVASTRMTTYNKVNKTDH